MRISDWSSDVCSSDLIVTRRGSYTFVKTAETTIRIIIPSIAYGRIQMKIVRLGFALDLRSKFARTASPEGFLSDFMLFREGQIGPVDPINRGRRSEEHTSELQSLMRISYAVFCLQTKKTIQTTQRHLIN